MAKRPARPGSVAIPRLQACKKMGQSQLHLSLRKSALVHEGGFPEGWMPTATHGQCEGSWRGIQVRAALRALDTVFFVCTTSWRCLIFRACLGAALPLLPPILVADDGEPYRFQRFVEIPESVELGAVSAVAIGPEGQTYVLHRGEPPLLAYDRSGKYTHGWGQGDFGVAHGLRVDSAGNVWATDNGLHVLWKFSRDGKVLAMFGEKGVGGNDDSHFRSPDDLVFASNGDIFVADAGNGRIVHMSPEGKFLGQWGRKGKAEGEFAAAHGIGIDARDRIYVADRGNNRVQVFSKDGKFLAAWSGFGNPFGVLVVGDELIVSDGDAHTISHLRLRDGKMTAQWGSPDTLLLPHLMDSDASGQLYVTEVNGQRVQVFRRTD